MATPPVLHVIYAGRGDCLILECDVPGSNPVVRQFILVDGGPQYYTSQDNIQAPYHLYLQNVIPQVTNGQAISKVIISHPDEDHYGGYKTMMAANNYPADLELFLPANKSQNETASVPVLQGININPPLGFRNTAAPTDDYLFQPVRAIFPPQGRIQYIRGPNVGGTRQVPNNPAAFNRGLDHNARSILMYTQEGVPNELPIFFTGDGDATEIARQMEAEFATRLQLQRPWRFAIYKIQHHGSFLDNALACPNTVTYAIINNRVWREAFILELCRILITAGSFQLQLYTIQNAATWVQNWLAQQNLTPQQYYDWIVARRRDMQTQVANDAFVVHVPGQRRRIVLTTPPVAGLPATFPDPPTLYDLLEEQVLGLRDDTIARAYDWGAFRRDVAEMKYKKWPDINRIREFYSRFRADAYVVSANSLNRHPRPEVLLALALAVWEQGRRARLYLTSGYSVKVEELVQLIEDLYLPMTANDLFCGNRLTLHYLFVGPYMSIDGTSNAWDTAEDVRDKSRATRPVVFDGADVAYRTALRSRFENWSQQGREKVENRRAKCRIRVATTNQDVYPVFGPLGMTWNIMAPGAGGAPTFIYVSLSEVPIPPAQNQGAQVLPFFQSELSTVPLSFQYQFSALHPNTNKPMWHWTDALGALTVIDGPNGGVLLQPGQGQVMVVYIEIVHDYDMLMMAPRPIIPLMQTVVMETSTFEGEGAEHPASLLDHAPPLEIAQGAVTTAAQPALPKPTLQQVLTDSGNPFPGAGAVDLVALLTYLFGDAALLKQTLDSMPQMILRAGFLDLDVDLLSSTASTAMRPMVGDLITSATLVCRTKPKSKVQWPADMNIAGLALSLDLITVTVINCLTKRAGMAVESSVSLSLAGKKGPPIRLGMAWTSAEPTPESGPIISFKAEVKSISELIGALTRPDDDPDGILDGQIPLVPKPTSTGGQEHEPPTLGKPNGPLHEIGFSIYQPLAATSQYEISSIWIRTEFSSWTSFLPVPAKFDKVVSKALVQVFHPFDSARRAVGGTISIEIPIPPAPSTEVLGGQRNLTATLSAIPYRSPGGTDYEYRFRILEQVRGVSLHDIARVAQEYFGVEDFTRDLTTGFPGFGKVVDVICLREMGFAVGQSKESGWSLDEWVVELSIPSFELIADKLSLLDSSLRVERFYNKGISFSGQATFQTAKGEKQATVGFATPTLGVDGYLSFTAPGGLNLAEIFDEFGLGDASQVPVLSDVATVSILSAKVTLTRPSAGGIEMSSFRAELRKDDLKLGPVTFKHLELNLEWQKRLPSDPEGEEGSVTTQPPTTAGEEGSSSFVTLTFSTGVPSINSVIQVKYDGEKKALTGSLSSESDMSPVSLGQILQAPIPGSGKASDQENEGKPGSFLTAYFDQDSVDALAEILDGIKIRSFGIAYGKSSSEGSSFLLTGVLGLGPVDMKLVFKNGGGKVPSEKDGNKILGATTDVKRQGDGDQSTDKKAAGNQPWSFEATLTVPSATSPAPPDVVKLGDLLGGLVGNDVKEVLPSFVSNIEFKRPKTQDQLSVVFKNVIPTKDASSTTPAELSPEYFVFFVNINVLGFSFSYTQCQEKRDPSGSGKDKPTPKPTKRIVSASLNAIPDIDIPLIGTVPKPVDQIFYHWIQDTSSTPKDKTRQPDPSTTATDKPDTTLRGLTCAEIDVINQARGEQVPKLVFKQTQGKLDNSTVVLAEGHHFMMTGKDSLGNATVILDYVFGKSAPSERSPKKAISEGDKSTTPPVAGGDDAKTKPPALAPYKKSAGPLSISNIGFGWKGTPKNGTLSIVFDASVVIGPIGFALLGFKLEFPITDKTSLQNLPVPDVSLDGLAASFNKPPLNISGAFMHKVVDGKSIYAGALLISYSVYLFQAAGFYGQVTDPITHEAYNSAFMFCRVNGPIMSVGWAELSGLVAGLGYNSSIRLPTAAEIPNFPLIAPPATTDPMSSLAELMKPNGGMISTKLDSFWVAAGVKVTAFQVLRVDAVLVLSFDPSIKIGIFGLAVADMPPPPPGGSGSSLGKFVHVELGLSATLDVALGVLKIEGQLTPASYILDPNCHLTGGFAMYSWFDSPDPSLKGDWVFTIGGYHRSFKPPAHYPVPPRLGISWAFSSHISISGEAYFAVTPKMCMGGGRLDVTLRAGPLKAWFNAYADFLINYKPFHFVAEGGVSVGVECTIDFCIASVTIGATLGATLFLQGPPLSGTITVDFWVTTFDINFGSPPDPIRDVQLDGFFDLVLQGGQGQGQGGMLAPAAAGGSSGDGKKPAELHVFSCQSGLVPTGKQDSAKDVPWVVRGAAFAFNISCVFAIVNCKVVSAAEKDEPATEKNSKTWSWGSVEGGQEPNPYPKPMKRATPLMSDVEIRIYRRDSVKKAAATNAPATIGTIDVGDNDDDGDGDAWKKVQRVIRPLSSAIWGKYDPSTDPSRRETDQSAMISGPSTDGTINLMTGVDIHGPDAKLSAESSAIEFNVAEAMGMNATTSGPNPLFPDIVRWEGYDNPLTNPLLPVQPTRPDWEVDADAITAGWKEKETVAGQVLALWTGSVAAFGGWEFDRGGGEGTGDDKDDKKTSAGDAGGEKEKKEEDKQQTLGILQAKAPGKTLKDFKDLYLDMPWLTAAAAA